MCVGNTGRTLQDSARTVTYLPRFLHTSLPYLPEWTSKKGNVPAYEYRELSYMAIKRTQFTEQSSSFETRGTPLIQVEHLCRIVETRVQKTVILDDINVEVTAHSLFAING